MKTHKLNVVITSLFSFVLFQFITCMAQTDFAEGWEKNTNKRQPPKMVMDSIGVKPGMVIGEIGAGRGRYTVHLAHRVGTSGKIYANDIDESALSYLRERCKKLSLNNVETILGKVDDPCLPKSTLDMVIMVWVYHHLDEAVPLLKNLARSLKPGARVIILDPNPAIEGESDSDRSTTKERVEREAAEAAYELVKVDTFLPKDLIFTIRVKHN